MATVSSKVTTNTVIVTGNLTIVQTKIQELITLGRTIVQVIKGTQGQWLIVHIV